MSYLKRKKKPTILLSYNTYRERKEEKKKSRLMRLHLGKAVLHSLSPVRGHLTVWLGSETFSDTEIKIPPQAVPGILPCLRLSSPVPDLTRTSLLCRTVCYLASDLTPVLSLVLVGSKRSSLLAAPEGHLETVSLC